MNHQNQIVPNLPQIAAPGRSQAASLSSPGASLRASLKPLGLENVVGSQAKKLLYFLHEDETPQRRGSFQS